MRPEFNYEPLTPTAYLQRAAQVFGDRVGVIDGATRFTYGEFLDRCLRFAGGLRGAAIGAGDRVAVLAGNTHVMLAAHYAVPFAGAVLVALNTRVTAADMAYILEHAGVSILIHDRDFAATAKSAAASAGGRVRLVCAGGSDDTLEALIADGKPHE